MNPKKLTFRQSAEPKRFQERSPGDTPWQRAEKGETDQPFAKKLSKKRPHFSRDSRDDAYSARRADKSGEAFAPRESVLQKAGNKGTVNVTVKGSTQAAYEKKTGPLSPRAPEKIRKNRAEEMKVYGENACLSLFAERPEAIVRLWATVEMSHKIGQVLSYLAAQKKVYHIVSSEELAKVSDSEHHGGICLLVKKRAPFTLSGYLAVERREDCLLLLDRVRNAHNIGALARTAAFYGVKGIVAENADALASAAAMRVAEGSMEYVHLLDTPYVDNALAQLRAAGYQVVHLSPNKRGELVSRQRFAPKSVFVLSEAPDEALVAAEDTQLVLSTVSPLKNGLNVAVAAGVLLGAWYSQD